MYISIKFGVHVFCWEVGVFNRSCFCSVSAVRYKIHTVQSLFLSEGAKRIFYNTTVILPDSSNETIARSGEMYEDDSDLFPSSLVLKCFGITNTFVQNFAVRIPSFKTVPKCLRKQRLF